MPAGLGAWLGGLQSGHQKAGWSTEGGEDAMCIRKLPIYKAVVFRALSTLLRAALVWFPAAGGVLTGSTDWQEAPE